jgi:hypothetical protein
VFLAEKMRERNPENAPKLGESVEIVIIAALKDAPFHEQVKLNL